MIYRDKVYKVIILNRESGITTTIFAKHHDGNELRKTLEKNSPKNEEILGVFWTGQFVKNNEKTLSTQF